MRILAEKDQSISENLQVEDIRSIIAQKNGLVWLDLDGEPVETCHKILEEVFQFHPLAIDDALVETHVPKIDDWGDYLYLALEGVHPEDPLEDINKSLELDVFMGKQYVVTYHPQKIRAIDSVWANCQRDQRLLQRGSNYLLYQLMDELANEYMLLIDWLDEQVEEIEDRVMEKADTSLLQAIFSIKRSLLNMRRIVAPQREVLNKLSRGDFELVSQKERMYYRDVYDHFVRVQDITENLRDLVSGALDTYLSVVNNRLNDIMKTLTIITTLFMPLSFLTGFFGMNFFEPGGNLRPWTSMVPFFITLTVMIGMPLGMYLWMHKRAWM
jgi:magnesium transporter